MIKLKDILIFFILLLIVVYIQKEFLSLAFIMGLKPDDWILYFSYKVLGSNPLSKIGTVWAERGAYTTYQIYYIGLLGDLIKFNWQLFHQINIHFKFLATISLYPLILVIFRKRVLAFLSTILYAASYSSVGSLEFVVKGSDYLAIFWMNNFLIVYYLIVRNKLRGFWWLIVSFVLLILAIIFSPIRLYPILIILPFFEAYLLIIKHKFTSIKTAFLRLFILYLPFLSLILYSPQAILGFLPNPLELIRSGNWHIQLTPLTGIGYLFIPNLYFGKVFGTLNTYSFPDYFIFLLGGPLVIQGVFTLFIAYLRINRAVIFSLIVLFINLIAQSLIFFIAFHYKSLPINIQQHYDQSDLYPTILGIYILILSLAIFIKWAKTKYTDNLLAALSLGGVFSIIFIWATWIAAPSLVRFSSTSYYLVVASLGSSIFISAILNMAFEKFQTSKILLIRLAILNIGLILLILIFIVSRNEIKERFTHFNLSGLNLMEQQQLQDKFRSALGKADLKKALFFFDTSELSGNGPLYSEGFLVAFPYWMHFDGNNLRDGCLEVIYENKDKPLLKKIVKVTPNEKGFYYRALCWENSKLVYQNLLYKPENFYAYKIINGEFISINDEVLRELGF